MICSNCLLPYYPFNGLDPPCPSQTTEPPLVWQLIVVPGFTVTFACLYPVTVKERGLC